MFLITRISKRFGIKNKESIIYFWSEIRLTLKISQKNKRARDFWHTLYVYILYPAYNKSRICDKRNNNDKYESHRVKSQEISF